MADIGKKVRRMAFGVGAVALIGGLFGGPHLDRDSYTVTVTDKERVVKKNGETSSSKYLVFTELQDGQTRVFENTDSFLEMKFNSSDIQGQLQEGGTYEIETYGWRIPMFSMYENIVGVNEHKR